MTITDLADLRLAVGNAAAFWRVLADVRGYELVERPGFLGVQGDERSGLRIVLLSPSPDEDDVAELTGLAKGWSRGSVLVEDALGSVDMSGIGLTPRQLPVMIRRPGDALPPPALEVIKVEREEQLGSAERIVVDGFPLPGFQPYRPGQVFPARVLEREGIELYLVAMDGELGGACVTVVDGGVGGLYWVTTLPEFRSRGIGRALMHAVLGGRLKELPVTLTAARAGKPLYDSLGFATITQSTWWSAG
ncbi:GNAT family N-acetyltransferase [Nonomuraea africana]|uniref:GNAT superfamily N-acetyltransferase n=1 Tax=Nonomuraea africana TaxID=46171 RepID=A0ABR9K893_9ACTN|nr:GNAT family N-acetyltransferase [Nonomuraea africana]MBE1558233.1 GNAT superfamily N-acetyltransferase [Nonomuraea africana]